MMVEIIVTNKPILILVANEAQIVWSRQILVQASKENSFHEVFCLPFGLLKDKRIITASGNIK
jgi:hypothetical protein